ncbi:MULTISPECIES: alkaline phosphatase family protein [Sphingobacterium]|uniref:alkaline phosphatase family protein n=1 Tax=Sphingobacterium TaxID=28453 RepID=UPI00257CC6E5|nr:MULTISPECIES: alkaline phosphatase family protein [Sphingobacterium]
MKMQDNFRNIHLWLIYLLLISTMAACKDEFGRVIPDNQGKQDTVDLVYGKPKVLLIIADGARGESVRNANIPVINGLLDHAIYSWVSLSEEHEDKQATGADLASIITGVTQNKHLVIGDNFSNNNLQTFPTVYTRIAANVKAPEFKVYSSSKLFVDNLAPTAVAKLEGSDQAVADAVKEGLKQPDLTMLTAHFTEIDKAGKATAYDNSSVRYKMAIENFDKQVGEITKALEQRSTFKKENWLVIITSSKGGPFEIPPAQNDNTIFSNANVNTFTIFYSPKYNSRFINKPYLGSRFSGDFLRFKGGIFAEMAEADTLFDLGDKNSEFTIELKVKKNKGPNNTYRFPNYPSFIGKREKWESGAPTNGWIMAFKEDYWMFNARGPNGSGEVNGSKLNNATWNNVTVVGSISSGGKRVIKTYTNGLPGNEMDVSDWGVIKSPAKLRLGLVNGGSNWNEGDYYIADVRFWKKALPESVVSQYNCEVGISEDHPYFHTLAANWPVVGTVTDGVLYDEGPFGNTLKVGNTTYEISKLNDFLCAPSVETISTLVPKSTDITAQIFSWLQIARQENWQLDGRVWIDK